jgi:hypothetical protein
MFKPENKKGQGISSVAAILASCCIVPLVGTVVYLTRRGSIKTGWLYLIAVCILACVFITIKAFPFSGGRPDRLLLRLYLAICLILTLQAVSLYEPHIPVIQDAIALGNIVLLMTVSYRPGMASIVRRQTPPAPEEKGHQ